MTSAPTPPAATPTPIDLNDEVKKLVDSSLADNFPIIIAYVDPDGQPSISFRGSTHVHSSNQLGIWVRREDGGLLNALEKNARITLFYRNTNPDTRAMITFRGKGRVENTPETREKMYAAIHEREQRADPEKRGIPLIIDLERVDGTVPGARLMMRKDA